MLRLDPCSNVVWKRRTGAHHSIERDADGNFWMPWNVVPRTVPQSVPQLDEHGLISISPDGEVLWLRSGPWLHQHDVDILSESEISVFSNNAADVGDGKSRVLGANEVYVYDFVTGEARSPWREAMRRHDVRTPWRGTAIVLDDGGLIVEESVYGRVLRWSADGEPVWSYVNRASDGLVYQLAGVRYLDAEYGASMARSIASFDCAAGRAGRQAPTPLRTVQ